MSRTVAIIGAGTMGGGIAISALAGGCRVTLIDTTEAALAAAEARIGKAFARMVEKGRMSAESAEASRAALSLSTRMEAVAGAALVIEAVFEDLAVKTGLLTRLAPHLDDEAVVATNTSALRVSDLAGCLPEPGRFLGLHFFSPADINPLVEVVRGAATSEDSLALALDYVTAMGKTPLTCRDANGFAVNRFFCPYTNEAVRIADEGLASPGQIDMVAREVFDLAIGPFAVMNIIKPRINLNAVRNLGALGPSYAPAAGLIAVGEAGDAWQIDEAPEAPDAALARLIADRLRAALFLPVLEELAEDVASPEDIDTGARLALRFGRPPVALMRETGETELREIVSRYCARFDTAFPDAGMRGVFG
ncbi:3-hydroxyacyl-CoA dehydrogenase family protein [Salipiger bermudensis]|nr:3-hydroxyacyl-CoA dehydrogenase family protein [Salipiger bermudensis]